MTILKEGEGDECPNETALLRCKPSFIHSFIHSLFLMDLLLHVFSCDISLSCIFLVKLIGKMQDGTVFLTEGHSDDDQGKLFEFTTDEGNFNFPYVSPSHINFFLHQLQ
jgi:hypothetical protein